MWLAALYGATGGNLGHEGNHQNTIQSKPGVMSDHQGSTLKSALAVMSRALQKLATAAITATHHLL